MNPEYPKRSHTVTPAKPAPIDHDACCFNWHGESPDAHSRPVAGTIEVYPDGALLVRPEGASSLVGRIEVGEARRMAGLILSGTVDDEQISILADRHKYQLKSKVYGELAFKWRKRCIDGGLANTDERLESDGWQEREALLAKTAAERDAAVAALEAEREAHGLAVKLGQASRNNHGCQCVECMPYWPVSNTTRIAEQKQTIARLQSELAEAKAQSLAPTVYTSNGEAGDGQTNCSVCGLELDEPHPFQACAESLRVQRDMGLDAALSRVSALEGELAEMTRQRDVFRESRSKIARSSNELSDRLRTELATAERRWGNWALDLLTERLKAHLTANMFLSVGAYIEQTRNQLLVGSALPAAPSAQPDDKRPVGFCVNGAGLVMPSKPTPSPSDDKRAQVAGEGLTPDEWAHLQEMLIEPPKVLPGLLAALKARREAATPGVSEPAKEKL